MHAQVVSDFYKQVVEGISSLAPVGVDAACPYIALARCERLGESAASASSSHEAGSSATRLRERLGCPSLGASTSDSCPRSASAASDGFDAATEQRLGYGGKERGMEGKSPSHQADNSQAFMGAVRRCRARLRHDGGACEGGNRGVRLGARHGGPDPHHSAAESRDAPGADAFAERMYGHEELDMSGEVRRPSDALPSASQPQAQATARAPRVELGGAVAGPLTWRVTLAYHGPSLGPWAWHPDQALNVEGLVAAAVAAFCPKRSAGGRHVCPPPPAVPAFLTLLCPPLFAC